MKRVALFVVTLFAGLQGAQAGGFMIHEMATRSTGMGSAFTAVADDASAAWHNPAGIAFTKGSQIMLGGADIIVPSADFTTNASNPLHPATTSAKSQSFLVPHAYFGFMDENTRLGTTLSINAPFGLEADWPSTAPFASKSTFSRIQMLNINPSVVFLVTDRLAIAGGVSYAYMSKVNLDNTVQLLSGNGDGWGGNAALFYKGDGFTLGVSYRSRIKVDVDGTATAVAGGALAAAPFAATTSTAKTSVTLPEMIYAGIAWMPDDQWTLSVDVDWVNWKTFDAINITYGSAAYRGAVGGLTTAVSGGGLAAIAAAIAAQAGSTTLPQNWKATVAVKVGAEWKYLPNMRARIGYVYDPTPIRDADFTPSIPGNDRHIFSVGYGHDFSENTTVDLAYAYVHFEDRNQTASAATPVGAPNSVKNGIYKSNAHVVAASLNYRF